MHQDPETSLDAATLFGHLCSHTRDKSAILATSIFHKSINCFDNRSPFHFCHYCTWSQIQSNPILGINVHLPFPYDHLLARSKGRVFRPHRRFTKSTAVLSLHEAYSEVNAVYQSLLHGSSPIRVRGATGRISPNAKVLFSTRSVEFAIRHQRHHHHHFYYQSFVSVPLSKAHS